MSKLSFRARALDNSKPMQIFRTDDVPDTAELSSIIRGVPRMPTGMEKEEECEHHLQRAISAQQAYGRTIDHVIPTPEVYIVENEHYDQLYTANFTMPRQLIHIQLSLFEQEQPEYDIDSEDEEWLIQMKPLLNISDTKFEEMIECLEKNSAVHKVIELPEAKPLLRGVDESVQISVYDYWLNKKLGVKKSLIPSVKTEKRDGISGNNPYIAFRRRTEKMQTRKNRKNDEHSYEKMLKLRKDFDSIRNILSLVRRRDITKREILKVDLEIWDTRYKAKDFDGCLYHELTSASRKEPLNKLNKSKIDDGIIRKRRTKRQKNELPSRTVNEFNEDFLTSEDDNSNDVVYQNNHINNIDDDADNPDGIFSFKRKKGCFYHAPLEKLSGWQWESSEGLNNEKLKINLQECYPDYFTGYFRRRIGRGGRIILDRLRIARNGDIVDDDDSDSEEIIQLKPLFGSENYHSDRETMEFNARHFEEDSDNIYNNHLKNYYEDNQIERHFYEYNQGQLLDFLKNNRQCLDEFPKGSKEHQSNDDNDPLMEPKCLFTTDFVKTIDVNLSNSILESIT